MKLLLLIALMMFQTLSAWGAHDGWRSGRATYYGERHDGSNDGFSIHHGSCQFGNLDPDVGTGWDIAALPDVHSDYHGSCGRCYEIACEPMVFTDNYGESLDRTDACIDPDRTVIVTVVDVCPCHYPKNLYSNKRWCCGDMDHFDVSIYAYEKIGMMEKGVIGIKYRQVPCPGADEPVAFIPPEALSMPPFPSEPEEVSDIETLRTAIKEASGEAVVISEGEPPRPKPKPSADTQPNEVEGSTTESDIESESDAEVKAETQPEVEGEAESDIDTEGEGRDVVRESETSPEAGEDANAEELAKEAEKESKAVEGEKSEKDGEGKKPSLAKAMGPSILLAAILVVMANLMIQ